MASYNVRVGFSCSFIQEQTEKNADPLNMLSNNIPKEYGPELIYYRFTFGVFRLNAYSVPLCKKIIEDSWKNIYPGQSFPPVRLMPPYRRSPAFS